MKQVYYIVGTLSALTGIFIAVCSIFEPGLDQFNSGMLLIVLGQLGFIQGNQQ